MFISDPTGRLSSMTLRPPDLFPQRALFLGQRTGELDVGGRVQIALHVRLAYNRHAVSLETEDLPGLRGLGHLEANRPGDGRHLRLAAQDGGGCRNRDFDVEVVPLPLEDR